jgi:hypothetical protein
VLGIFEQTLSPARALIYLYDEAASAYRAHDAQGLATEPALGRDGEVASRLRDTARQFMWAIIRGSGVD